MTYFIDLDSDWIDENTTMPAGDYEVSADPTFTGWCVYDTDGDGKSTDKDGKEFVKAGVKIVESGWYELPVFDLDAAPGTVSGTAWYYIEEVELDDSTVFVRAEGVTRVPYPTVAINRVTYAPNAEDVAYADFFDATEAWFVFDEDGKFQNDLTGKGEYLGETRWVDNGMIAWHPGVVEVNGAYYYFIGDEVNGGNILPKDPGSKSGYVDVYVSRVHSSVKSREFVIGGVYSFYNYNGELASLYGICNYTNNNGKRVLRYYGMDGADENRLHLGDGLIKFFSNYMYVRSNGELVANTYYYVPKNDLGIVSKTYDFDENGHMINPEFVTKNGIFEENGALYYYEKGELAYGKGFVELANGDKIYVRSNGQLAVGEYYIANVKYEFDTETGIMKAAKNGIVDGYYYVNNAVQYNAGVIEIDGNYYYVRSNGQVVTGQSYWITNVGESGLVAKKYTFDANGVMQNPEFISELKNGVVDGYYYVDGHIQYGAGLIEYNGGYIYVRSNGQLATGKYWVTNHNGLLEEASYDFGTDGIYYAA